MQKHKPNQEIPQQPFGHPPQPQYTQPHPQNVPHPHHFAHPPYYFNYPPNYPNNYPPSYPPHFMNPNMASPKNAEHVNTEKKQPVNTTPKNVPNTHYPPQRPHFHQHQYPNLNQNFSTQQMPGYQARGYPIQYPPYHPNQIPHQNVPHRPNTHQNVKNMQMKKEGSPVTPNTPKSPTEPPKTQENKPFYQSPYGFQFPNYPNVQNPYPFPPNYPHNYPPNIHSNIQHFNDTPLSPSMQTQPVKDDLLGDFNFEEKTEVPQEVNTNIIEKDETPSNLPNPPIPQNEQKDTFELSDLEKIMQMRKMQRLEEMKKKNEQKNEQKNEPKNEQKENVTVPVPITNQSQEINVQNDEEDDFGDFQSAKADEPTKDEMIDSKPEKQVEHKEEPIKQNEMLLFGFDEPKQKNEILNQDSNQSPPLENTLSFDDSKNGDFTTGLNMETKKETKPTLPHDKSENIQTIQMPPQKSEEFSIPPFPKKEKESSPPISQPPKTEAPTKPKKIDIESILDAFEETKVVKAFTGALEAIETQTNIKSNTQTNLLDGFDDMFSTPVPMNEDVPKMETVQPIQTLEMPKPVFPQEEKFEEEEWGDFQDGTFDEPPKEELIKEPTITIQKEQPTQKEQPIIQNEQPTIQMFYEPSKENIEEPKMETMDPPIMITPLETNKKPIELLSKEESKPVECTPEFPKEENIEEDDWGDFQNASFDEPPKEELIKDSTIQQEQPTQKEQSTVQNEQPIIQKEQPIIQNEQQNIQKEEQMTQKETPKPPEEVKQDIPKVETKDVPKEDPIIPPPKENKIESFKNDLLRLFDTIETKEEKNEKKLNFNLDGFDASLPKMETKPSTTKFNLDFDLEPMENTPQTKNNIGNQEEEFDVDFDANFQKAEDFETTNQRFEQKKTIETEPVKELQTMSLDDFLSQPVEETAIEPVNEHEELLKKLVFQERFDEAYILNEQIKKNTIDIQDCWKRNCMDNFAHVEIQKLISYFVPENEANKYNQLYKSCNYTNVRELEEARIWKRTAIRKAKLLFLEFAPTVRLLLECLKEIETAFQFCEKLNKCSTNEIEEILADQKTITFFKAIAEIYKISHFCVDYLNRKKKFALKAKILGNLKLFKDFSEKYFKMLNVEIVQKESSDGIYCKLTGKAFDKKDICDWRGNHIFIPAANIWVMRISKMPPKL